MKKDKPPTTEDNSSPESDTQEMNTLFSSDDTELTDFTERVKRAMRGEGPESEDKQAVREETKRSTFKNNVVNLFKPK